MSNTRLMLVYIIFRNTRIITLFPRITRAAHNPVHGHDVHTITQDDMIASC